MTESKSVALPLGDAPTEPRETSASHPRSGAEDSDNVAGAQPTRGIKIDLGWGLAGSMAEGYNAASYWSGVWRSLVAHLVRDEGVGGSNPLTPTNSIIGLPEPGQDVKKAAYPHTGQPPF